jgi:signal transduction histidine kinase
VLNISPETTARVRAEAALRAARATEAEHTRLGELFAQVPAAICLLLGPDHIFCLANPPYLELTGGRDILDRPLLEALPALAGQGIVELLDGVCGTGEATGGDAVRVARDRDRDGVAEAIYFDFVYAPLRGAGGATEGAFVHAYDVTDTVRVRLAVEEAVRARDTFLSIAAHELRTPLTALKGATQLLVRRLGRGPLDDARRARSLATLDTSADRLGALTNDLLDVPRIRTGQLPSPRARSIWPRWSPGRSRRRATGRARGIA